ncbi:AraC-like DNA-binding protein [Breznakia blatticola]|uniref:AraC-like DNA-binding protein n=1 Tax=Breznakia blatticola TaxID=1754012 RepID=A0A4R7ZT17_9FIRM|nr:AraC family transcriptional regulator [Breznakia blatticola]TDW20051.1 AraC-like DNA-binding protein [Breznakia blatticola]
MSNNRYQIIRKQHEKTKLVLRYITHAQRGSDWHSVKHVHDFTEIFFVVNGKGRFLIDNESFSTYSDDVVIISSKIPHTESPMENEDFEYIVLGVEGLELQDHNGNKLVRQVFNLNSEHDKMMFYLNVLLQEVELKNERYEAICHNILEVLIFLIIRSNDKQLSYRSITKGMKECEIIENYIKANYHKNITLDDLSELTYLSKFYISHAFKRYKGISPISYLIQTRIQHAKKLLESTNKSMAQIATDVGFVSQSHFSQTFKQETNHTPFEYRKLSQELKQDTDRQ